MGYTWAVGNPFSPNPEHENALFDAGSPSSGRAFLWIGTATLTGAIVMAMELTAFRLYAPYFGNSIYVWGSMISVVMLALSAGYSLGGWIADRKPTDVVLFLIILGSGVYQLAIVFVQRSVMLKLWQMGDFAGAGVGDGYYFRASDDGSGDDIAIRDPSTGAHGDTWGLR